MLPAAAGSADQPMADRPVLNKGDVFEYVDRFQTIACQRWEVDGVHEGGLLLSRCGDNSAYFAADSGALIRITGKNGKELIRFEPSAPAIPFPLYIGAKWNGKFRLSMAGDPVSPSLDQSCKVTSFEMVTITSGRLPAFRIDCTNTWTVWPLHGHVVVTSWYAPDAKTVIKVVNDSDPAWNLALARYSLI